MNKLILCNIGLSIIYNLYRGNDAKKSVYSEIMNDIKEGVNELEKRLEKVYSLIRTDESRYISAEVKSIELFNSYLEYKLDENYEVILVCSNTYEGILAAKINKKILEKRFSEVNFKIDIIKHMNISEVTFENSEYRKGNLYNRRNVRNSVISFKNLCNKYNINKYSEKYFCISGGYKITAKESLIFSVKNNFKPFIVHESNDFLKVFDSNDYRFNFKSPKLPDEGKKLILFTVGISLLSSIFKIKEIMIRLGLGDNYKDFCNLIEKSSNDEFEEIESIVYEILEHSIKDYKYLTPEIKSIYLLLKNENLDKYNIDIVPLPSDSKLCIFCTRLIIRLLKLVLKKEHDNISIKNEDVIENLNLANNTKESWNKGLESLKNKLGKYIKQSGYMDKFICINGGYKFVSAYACYISEISENITTKYVHIESEYIL